LKTKSQKTNYDDLLIKLLKHLFDSKFSKVSVQNLEELQLAYFQSVEIYYMIDMAGMAMEECGK
jgi:hypothetical protein